ncbi:hypothetical protein ACWCPQ_34715 [Nocardia sp. NPDC001965]
MTRQTDVGRGAVQCEHRPYGDVPGRVDGWRPNEPFKVALRVVGTERGQSAARFVLKDTASGVRYPLSMTELLAIVQMTTIERGVVLGRCVGCKRGANYGIRLLSQEEAI